MLTGERVQREVELLLDVRDRIQRKGYTLTQACAVVPGVHVKGINIMRCNHAIDYNERRPRTNVTKRRLVLKAYGSWVGSDRLVKGLDYASRSCVKQLLFELCVEQSLDPWDYPPPKISFRKMVEILPAVYHHESICVVAHNCGIPLAHLLQVFGLDKEKDMRYGLRRTR